MGLSRLQLIWSSWNQAISDWFVQSIGLARWLVHLSTGWYGFMNSDYNTSPSYKLYFQCMLPFCPFRLIGYFAVEGEHWCNSKGVNALKFINSNWTLTTRPELKKIKEKLNEMISLSLLLACEVEEENDQNNINLFINC